MDINALSLYTLGELRKTSDKPLIQEYQKVFRNIFKKFNFKINRLFLSKFEVVDVEKKSVNYTIVNSKVVLVKEIQK